MTSCDTDDVKIGKISDLTLTAKSCVNIKRFLLKFQNILFLVRIDTALFLEIIATHKVVKMVDRNFQNFHILSKFLKFAPISKKIYTFLISVII